MAMSYSLNLSLAPLEGEGCVGSGLLLDDRDQEAVIWWCGVVKVCKAIIHLSSQGV